MTPITTGETSAGTAQKNFIGGAWVPSHTGEIFSRHSPFDQSFVAEYQDSDAVDVQRAIVVARQAFDAGPWPRTPAVERARVLERAASLLRQRVDDLAQVMTREISQPNMRGAVLAEADQLDYYAGLIVSRRDEAVYSQSDQGMGLIVREPIGVVGALTAWNAPLSIVHKGLPAVAAGCTVVAKPAHQSCGATVKLAGFSMTPGSRRAYSTWSRAGARTGRWSGLHSPRASRSMRSHSPGRARRASRSREPVRRT